MSETQAGSAETALSLPDRLEVNEHIALERMLPLDAQSTHDLVYQNREHLAATQPWAMESNLEIVTAGLEAMMANAVAGRSVAYKIIDDQQYVGTVNLFDRQSTTATMGYWLAKDAQGKGVMTVSARRLAQFAFDEWGVTEIKLEISKSNKRSLKAAQNIGAKLIGANPENADEEIWKITKDEH